MARIFITGSSDGIGSLAAKALVKRGHQVTLHARNEKRAADASKACPGAEGVLIADLSNVDETKALAKELNENGPWDTIIHNAGVMRGVSGSTLFTVNTLSPYILTCLTNPPKRQVFLSSSMHQGGDASLRNIQSCGYSDSKLHNTMLAFAFARKWPSVLSNSVDPGWVVTKMGGRGATDDINESVDTYVMLAEDSGAAKGQSGKHWRSSKQYRFMAAAGDESIQEELIRQLQQISGISIPSALQAKA